MSRDLTTHPLDDDPKKLKLGWIICEYPPGEEGDKKHDDYLRKTLSPEAYKKYQYQSSIQCGLATDRADNYRSEHAVKVENGKCGYVYSDIQVLPELVGLPWNNLTLNLVLALNPSYIRVSTGRVTLDSMQNRITVILEDDNITIRKITYEAAIPSYGVVNGHDLKIQLSKLRNKESLDNYKYNTPSAIISDYAIKRVLAK